MVLSLGAAIIRGVGIPGMCSSEMISADGNRQLHSQLCGKERFYGHTPLYRNVNRLIDTKEMNRISGKPLKTRGSGTLFVAGIPCLILGLCQGSTGEAVTDGHSGHESAPSVAVLPPPPVQCAPSERYRRSRSDTLEKKQML